MNKFIRVVICIAIVFVSVEKSKAALIIDTGEPNVSGWNYYEVSTSIGLAAEFVLLEDFTITGVQGWIANLGGVDYTNYLRISLHDDDSINSDIPGSVLFSEALILDIPYLEDGWHGLSGLDLDLQAGTYWLSFMGDAQSTYMGMEVSPPDVLPFALSINAAWYPQSDNPNGIGIRVYGERQGQVVPEPSTMLLLSLGMLGLAGLQRVRRN